MTKRQEFINLLFATRMEMANTIMLALGDNDGIGSKEEAVKTAYDAVIKLLSSDDMEPAPGQTAKPMEREELPGFEVQLTYFNPHGKFKYEGTYRTFRKELYEIFDEVREMHSSRKLPGLVEGHSEYIVHVSVPKHPHNYPSLIIEGETNE